MAKSVVKYDLLISCPGDVQDEIDLIKDCVEEFNERFSDTLGVMVQTRHWKTSSYSQSGGKPQDLLNEQFVNDCDAAVAVFWTRFGTPTDRYESGTEEEIEIMLDAGRQVFMYFSDKPFSPSKIDSDQYAKIMSFRDKYKDKGIYFMYDSNDEFRKLFFSHLTKFFLSKKQIEEYESKNMPNLVIRGISTDNTIEEIPHIQKIKPDKLYDFPTVLNMIKSTYEEIRTLELECSNPLAGRQLHTLKKVEIEDNYRKILSGFAEALSIEMGDSFFDLGGLMEDSWGSLPALDRHNFVGGKNEEKKYHLINELVHDVLEYVARIPIENAYSNLDCLYLALENNGTAIDEDVDIMLWFNKNDLVTVEDRPKLSDEDAKYLVKNCNLFERLEIEGSADFSSYAESSKLVHGVNPVYPVGDILGLNPRDYQQEYAEAFEDALGYSIYAKGEMLIVKVRIDYIKHNSVVAFPAPIMLKGLPSVVKYKICSKHVTNAVEGELKIVQ